jgi:hypothetical protein
VALHVSVLGAQSINKMWMEMLTPSCTAEIVHQTAQVASTTNVEQPGPPLFLLIHHQAGHLHYYWDEKQRRPLRIGLDLPQRHTISSWISMLGKNMMMRWTPRDPLIQSSVNCPRNLFYRRTRFPLRRTKLRQRAAALGSGSRLNEIAASQRALWSGVGCGCNFQDGEGNPPTQLLGDSKRIAVTSSCNASCLCNISLVDKTLLAEESFHAYQAQNCQSYFACHSSIHEFCHYIAFVISVGWEPHQLGRYHIPSLVANYRFRPLSSKTKPGHL